MSANLQVAPTVVALQVEPDVVKHLEDWLAQAKAGEIISVGIASVTVRNEARTAYAGSNLILLLGSAAVLQHRLNKALE